MLYKSLRLFPFFVLVGLIVFAYQVALTQNSNETCDTVVQQAFIKVGDVCSDVERNAACYGYNRLRPIFNTEVENNYFTKPADQTDIRKLLSLQTADLDPQTDEWGIAVLNLQANLPNTLPGQSLRFILLGNVNVRNDVPPDDLVTSTKPITLHVAEAADIHVAPAADTEVVTSVEAGTALVGDERSDDSLWIRVTAGDSTFGWIPAASITETESMTALPTESTRPLAPMQAFHIQASGTGISCSQSPAVLVVQSPHKTQVKISANGAEIILGSTIVLWTTEDGRLVILTIDGLATIDGVKIPTGFRADAPIDPTTKDVIGEFSNLRLMSPAEFDILKTLDNIPESILNYKIVVDSSLVQALPTPTPTATPQLIVTPKPATAVPTTCNNFRATSPLDGLNYGSNIFYWDGIHTATTYRVNVYNLDKDSVLVRSFETANNQTNLTASITNETVGLGFKFAWEVQALVNGVAVCTTTRVFVPRASRPNGTTRTSTPINTATSLYTSTPSNTPTNTFTPTVSNTPSNTPTSTVSSTPSNTATSTYTSTPTNTPTSTYTNTPTNTPTNTLVPTPTSTASPTP